MLKGEIRSRILMIERNLHGSRVRLVRGEISQEEFDRIHKDATRRIAELKAEMRRGENIG